MKNLIQTLFAVCCIALPALLHAQADDDSKYLAGAVPEVDGKVVFSKEFSIPGMSQDEIFDRMQSWIDARLTQNENNSRVVFTDRAKGQIVGTGDEWIVFTSTALSLDRTRILYQPTVVCQPEKCVLNIEKIRYVYREGKEKYTAEEWIVDKYALNKDKTKLTRGLAKWRRKTVDFVDALCLGAADALSATQVASSQVASSQVADSKEASKKEEKAVVNSGTTVIVPKNAVTVAERVQTPEVKPETVPAAEVAEAPAAETPKAETTVTETKTIPQPYKAINPAELSADLIQPSAGRLVIVIGEEPFNMTMMTANSGGSLGKVGGKPVVFTILSPDQPYQTLEQAERYTVRFYPNGQTEPTLVLECKPVPAPAAVEGMPRTYVGEILNAQVKND